MLNEQEIRGALAGFDPGGLLPGAKPTAQALCHPWPAAQIKALEERGAAWRDTPAPPLRWREFRLFEETGDRLQYQAAYYERRGRLLVFSLLEWLRPGQGWLAVLEDSIWDICAEAYWCLPAHFMGPGDVPLPFGDYDTCLDLFACETAFALAECHALHKDTLSPLIAHRLREAVKGRVLRPFADEKLHPRFMDMANNWSGVCASAIGGAALYLEEDPAARAAILAKAGRALVVYLGSFGPDGVCEEGLAYWAYGFGFYTCFGELLHRASGGKIDILAGEKPAAIARAQQHCYLQNGVTLSFSDGHTATPWRMGLTCFLHRRFAGVHIPPIEYAAPVLEDSCYRYCLALRDFVWFDPAAPFGAGEVESVWLPSAQWLVSRGAHTTLAAKGGHNAESHNHNDTGSFIYCQNGVMLLCDLGAGLYDRNYFSDKRYSLFLPSSHAHNLPLVEDTPQSPGREYAASDCDAALGEEANRLTVQLAPCYAVPHLQSFTRRLTHRHGKDMLELRDSFVFTKPAKIVESFVTDGAASLPVEGRVLIQKAGQRLCLGYDATLFAAGIEEEAYTGFDGRPHTARLVRLRQRVASEEITCPILCEEDTESHGE